MVHEDLSVPFEVTVECKTISLEFAASHLKCIPKRTKNTFGCLT